MFGKRRRRGTGLMGIVLVVALLYFTGAGTWLWNRISQAETQCYSLLAQMGTSIGSPICSGVGTAIKAADSAFSGLSDGKAVFERAKDAVLSLFSGGSLSSVVGNIHIPASLNDLRSTGDQLSLRMRLGPEMLPVGKTPSEMLNNAMDSLHIGQTLMSGTGNSTQNALPWLQQGARSNGYGLLPQLSLGDIYRQGSGDVKANPQAAEAYYRQAYQSITTLQHSNSPEAQKLLSALPDSPDATKQRLVEAIKQLQ